MIDRTVKLEPRKAHDQAACRAVADDIRRVLGRDPILREATRTEIEFLMSMGLTVKEPSERCKLLAESMTYVRIFGKAASFRR